ncbi:hypothetical protein DL767_000844 [Monosporascus sp. MG133]|nr:hypothetical protein DL767_000844 [Monosporascus sp. MG133]
MAPSGSGITVALEFFAGSSRHKRDYAVAEDVVTEIVKDGVVVHDEDDGGVAAVTVAEVVLAAVLTGAGRKVIGVKELRVTSMSLLGP